MARCHPIRSCLGAGSALWLILCPPASAQDAFLNGVRIEDYNSNADLFVNDNTVLDGKVCIGDDCLLGESYDDNTLLKLRFNTTNGILFHDTSSSSFPNRDWRLRINERPRFNEGGFERFSVEDLDGAAIPFTIAGGVPENAFWLAAPEGHLGLGTSLPQVDLHIVAGDTPALRLDQDGSGGQTPHHWDILANDAMFAIRDKDATLPVRIVAGAPDAALALDGAGRLGLGTATPAAPLHLIRTGQDTSFDPQAGLLVEVAGDPAPRGLLALRNEGQVFFSLEDTSITAGPNSGRSWNFQNLGGEFRVTTAPGGGDDIEMRLTTAGDMIIEGNYFANSFTQMQVPDYVFEADYALRPLSEVAAFITAHKHLPEVPSAAMIVAQGVNLNEMQMTLLKKIEELTLYTLAQADEIADLKADLARLARIEAMLAE